MIFAAIVLSVVSLVVRYRRASGLERQERQQLKWFEGADSLLVRSVPSPYDRGEAMLFRARYGKL